MTETQLKTKVQKYLKSIGALAFKISDRFNAGYPDLWICYKGRAAWIELKTPTGKVSAIQQWTIDQIQKAGGEAYVCRSVEQVKEIFTCAAQHAETEALPRE